MIFSLYTPSTHCYQIEKFPTLFLHGLQLGVQSAVFTLQPLVLVDEGCEFRRRRRRRWSLLFVVIGAVLLCRYSCCLWLYIRLLLVGRCLPPANLAELVSLALPETVVAEFPPVRRNFAESLYDDVISMKYEIRDATYILHDQFF